MAGPCRRRLRKEKHLQVECQKGICHWQMFATNGSDRARGKVRLVFPFPPFQGCRPNGEFVAELRRVYTDDKRLQSTLKRLGVNSIPGIEEVNLFKQDGSIVHFKNPQVQASIGANTYVISGSAENKKLQDLLPGESDTVQPSTPFAWIAVLDVHSTRLHNPRLPAFSFYVL